MATPWRENEPQIKAGIYFDGPNYLRTRLQRLVDLDLQHALVIVLRDAADHLVSDLAVTTDDEGFGYAIHAPFDRGAAVAIDADDAERIAVAAEKTARVVRRILVVDPDKLQPLVL